MLGKITRMAVIYPYVMLYDYDRSGDVLTILRILHDQYCPVNLRGISEKANSGAAFWMTKGVSDLNQK